MSLVAWAVMPNSAAYGAPDELPVKTSVCEVGTPFTPHPYGGRKVSIEGIVAYDLVRGGDLLDASCFSNALVRISLPATQDDSVVALLDLVRWVWRSPDLNGNSPRCVCIGTLEYTPIPVLRLERVEKVWLPK